MATAEDHESALADIPDPVGERLAEVLTTGDEQHAIEWMKTNKVKKSDLAVIHEPTGSSILLLSIQFGMVHIAQKLLKGGATPSGANKRGDTALHWACCRGAEPGMAALVESLLVAGADPNAVGDLQNTPLHLAAATNCPMVIKLMLMYGADASITNKYGHRPPALATDPGCLELFTRLKEDGEAYRTYLKSRLQAERDEAARVAAEDAAAQLEKERGTQAALLKAQKRREAEDIAQAEAIAEDQRRREEEIERRKKDKEERLRAVEEQRRNQEEMTKLNKKAKTK